MENGTTWLGNAYSIQMIAELILAGLSADVRFEPVKLEDVKTQLLANGFTSVIGHQDLADRASEMSGFEVPMNRVNNSLKKGDSYFMLQVFGGRLPEGTKELPTGVRLEWVKVTLL